MMTCICRRFAFALLTAGLFTGSPALAQEKLKAVASFSILGDLVAQVGGDRISVTTLVGPNGDAHVYEPKPDDARQVANAGIMFINGLGFEGWLDRLLKASNSTIKVVTLSEGVSMAMAAEGKDDHDHDHTGPDPHAWQSVPNVRVYVKNIAASLCEADKEGCETYKASAAAYDSKLQALDADIRAAINSIPEDRRIVITSHDAFTYFAREYGVTFHAPEGVSTESEASAKDVARLIEQIRTDKASALFVENLADPRLIEQISSETGIAIGGALYSDALSDADGPASSYIEMMRHNSSALAKAMMAH